MLGSRSRICILGLVIAVAVAIDRPAAADAQVFNRPTTRPSAAQQPSEQLSPAQLPSARVSPAQLSSAQPSLAQLSSARTITPAWHEWIPAGFHAVRNLQYVLYGSPSQTLDVYVPDHFTAPRPLIIWVHGGAWMSGDKTGAPGLAFLTHGFVMASINYRLSGEATYPAQIEDCRSAIRFLRANAARFDIDPTRIGVWGHSAGGHLVALLGATNGHRGYTYLLPAPVVNAVTGNLKNATFNASGFRPAFSPAAGNLPLQANFKTAANQACLMPVSGSFATALSGPFASNDHAAIPATPPATPTAAYAAAAGSAPFAIPSATADASAMPGAAAATAASSTTSTYGVNAISSSADHSTTPTASGDAAGISATGGASVAIPSYAIRGGVDQNPAVQSWALPNASISSGAFQSDAVQSQAVAGGADSGRIGQSESTETYAYPKNQTPDNRLQAFSNSVNAQLPGNGFGYRYATGNNNFQASVGAAFGGSFGARNNFGGNFAGNAPANAAAVNAAPADGAPAGSGDASGNNAAASKAPRIIFVDQVSSDVQAVCDWYGPTDLLSMGTNTPGGRPIVRLLGAPQPSVPALAAAASPLDQVGHAALPPFLIMHGDVDPIVPVRQSQIFYARLKQAGDRVQLVILPHTGHGDGLFHSSGAYWTVVNFFDRALRAAPPAMALKSTADSRRVSAN
jgi:acetyl esterase/lipase